MSRSRWGLIRAFFNFMNIVASWLMMVHFYQTIAYIYTRNHMLSMPVDVQLVIDDGFNAPVFFPAY